MRWRLVPLVKLPKPVGLAAETDTNSANATQARAGARKLCFHALDKLTHINFSLVHTPAHELTAVRNARIHANGEVAERFLQCFKEGIEPSLAFRPFLSQHLLQLFSLFLVGLAFLSGTGDRSRETVDALAEHQCPLGILLLLL